jgi:hypothetical protein
MQIRQVTPRHERCFYKDAVTLYRQILPFVLVSVLAGTAAAENAVRAPDASAVAIMADSGQALLWDADRGEYLLVKAGDHFQRFFVVTIEGDHVLVAQLDNPKVRHVLQLSTAPTVRARPATPTGPIVIQLAGDGAAGADDVLDPYSQSYGPHAGSGSDGLAVVDPYGAATAKSPTPVEPTVVQAPPQSRVESVASPSVVPLLDSNRYKIAAPAPAVEAPIEPEYDVDPDPLPAAKADPNVPEKRTVRLKRGEFDDAISDFAALSKQVQLEKAKGGGVRVTGIARGSFFYRAGLRKGDVVRKVAGESITNMESAARIYARILGADRIDVEVDRGRTQLEIALHLE